MADEADIAHKAEEHHRQIALRNSRVPLEQGAAGECEYCGYQFARIVRGACGACRDKHRLG